MALSGSFSGSIVSGKYKLRADWSATQNVSKNTSKITVAMYLVQASSWSLNINSRSDNATTINGTKHTWSSPAINNSGGKTTKLATVTSGEITHNADGTKSVTISATFEINATISGTYRDTITASATVTLNTIPRATQPSLSASSANMGSLVTISTPRASSSFTHDLAYRLGSGSWVSIATGVGTSYSWTVPDVASQLPSATSGTLTVRCITKRSGATIGTKTTSLVAKVPTSVVPTVSAVAVSEAAAGLAAQFGAYIQNKSALLVNITAAGAKGSSIKAYKSTLLGKTYTAKSFTSAVLASSGTATLSVKVQDSRGRWSAAKNVTVSILAYATPKIQALAVYRVNSAGTADEQGEYIRADYRYGVTSLSSKNTANAVIEYKRSTESTWSTLQTETALSANKSIKPATPTFSTDYQYDVRLSVTDWFGAVARYTSILPSGAVILDLLANGKGIALGKTAEREGFDIGWDFVDGVMSADTYVGQWQMPNGPLIQWGTVTITPSAANTPTTVTVNFPYTYTSRPVVQVTAVTSAPENCYLGIAGRAAGSIDIVLTRSGTKATAVQWLAIGPRVL